MANDVTTKILDIQVRFGDALKQIAEYRAQVSATQEEMKKWKEANKNGTLSNDEYAKSIEAARMSMAQQNTAILTLTRQIQNQMKAEKEENGSLVSLRAQLSNLTTAYDRLSKSEREGAKGKELRDKINDTTKVLKEAEEGTQRFFRNVGNYPDSVKPVAEQLEVLNAKIEELKASGQETTPEFEELCNKVERLKSVLEQSSQEGSISLGGIVKGVNEVATAFVVWKNAAKELGIENETLDSAVSGLMTVLTTYTAMSKAIAAMEKSQAVMKTALAVKTWILNTALGAQATATAAVTVAEGGAAIATWLWNAALYANPLVWLIGIIMAAVAAVGALVAAFNWFSSSNDEAIESCKSMKESLENLHAQNKALIEVSKERGDSEAKQAALRLKLLDDEYQAHVEYFNKVKELYDEDDDEFIEARKSMTEAHVESLRALTDNQKIVNRVMREEVELMKEQQMGDFAYKVDRIKRDIQDLIGMATQLQKKGVMTLDQLDAFTRAVERRKSRLLGEAMKEDAEKMEKELEKAQKELEERQRKAAEAAQKAAEEEKKRKEALLKETQIAEDAMIQLIENTYEREAEAEKVSFKRKKEEIRNKLALYDESTSYGRLMIEQLQDQLRALEWSHERKMEKLQMEELQRLIKTEEEKINAKLKIAKKGSEEEEQLKAALLEQQHEYELNEIKNRIAEGILTEEDGNALLLASQEAYLKNRKELREEYAKIELEQQKKVLQNEIDQLAISESEKQLHRKAWRTMTDEEMEADRTHKLESIGGYEADRLRLEEENAQKAYEALLARGQLSSQTEAEWLAEQNEAKQEWLNKQVAINEAYVKNEQAKQQAVRAVTDGLVSLLEALGDENSAYAKMAKVITLAQIAIDTGRALSSGIASASALPFPANMAAIATTVATVLANVAKAISTVKSAKFAAGGKVTGPGSGTSDSIPAMLSNGEYVMTAKATRIFEPLLAAMNNIGSGVPIQVAKSYESVDNAEMLTDSFEKAAREIKPVVSVVEITETQDRVEMIENLDTF